MKLTEEQEETLGRFVAEREGMNFHDALDLVWDILDEIDKMN